MRRFTKYFFLIVCALTALQVAAQTEKYMRKVDSLKRALEIAGSDTQKVNICNRLSDYYQVLMMHKEAMSRASEALALATKIKFKKGEVMAYNNIGLVSFAQADYRRAEAYYHKALAEATAINYYMGMAGTLNNLGNLEENNGNYNKALEYFLESLDYEEKCGDRRGAAIALNNIAVVYSDLGDTKNELAYNYKSLAIRKTINDPVNLAASYNNLGVTYLNLDNYDSAVYYYQKSLYLRQKAGDKKGIAASYHNIAICQKSKGNFAEAEENYKQALEIQLATDDKDGLALTYLNLGKFYFDTKNYRKSIEYLKKSLLVSQELNYLDNLKEAHQSLYEAYEKLGDTKLALFHHVKFTELKDSLINTEQAQEFTRIEMQHSFDKQNELKRIEQERKDVQAREEKRMQQFIIAGVSILLLVVLVFSFFVYRSFREKQRANIIITQQKREVEMQKHIVEAKQKEILDSIRYAKRIQSSLLASEIYIERSLRKLQGNTREDKC